MFVLIFAYLIGAWVVVLVLGMPVLAVVALTRQVRAWMWPEIPEGPKPPPTPAELAEAARQRRLSGRLGPYWAAVERQEAREAAEWRAKILGRP